MSFFTRALALTAALTSVGGAYAKLDLDSRDNVVVYWGQNSIGASSNKDQERLSYYCDNDDIDVIVMSFIMKINGPGGAPEYDFANISKGCETFPGTGLKKCPDVAEDIATCQKKGKTILLSIGGATYSEGGFDSEESAQAGAESVWKTFGPGGNGSSSDSTPSQSTTKAMAQSTSGQAPTQGQSYGQQKGTAQGQNAGQVQSTSQGQGSSQGQGYGQGQSYGQEQSYDQGQSYDQNQDYGQAQDYSQGQGNGQQSSYWDQSDFVRRSFGASSSVHRPFGNVVVDGFDLDFEASTSNMNAFAQRLRDLMDAESDRKYFLTAAPQCPYPDAADKDFLNGPGPVSMDAVFVQFYNNPCGLGSFQNGGVKTQSTFNFQTWDNWAKDGSKNKDVKVLLGVPASKDAATNGFVSAKDLEPIIDYAKKFDSFGGVMVWEASQADANKGFLSSVGKALKGTPSRVKRYAFRRN